MIIDIENMCGRLYASHGMRVMYKDGYTSWVKPCTFTCSIHGDFITVPKGLVEKRNSCKGCKLKTMSQKSSFRGNSLIQGVGVMDLDINLFSDINRYKKVKNLWSRMLERCYSKSEKLKSYHDCSVSEDWLRCSRFFEDLRDFENYEMIYHGWHLDKDVISKGNRVYSKETCCIIPNEINSIFNKAKAHRGKYPIGVSFDNRCNKFIAYVHCDRKFKFIGCFSDEVSAFNAYKRRKEEIIQMKANKLRSVIGERVYTSMMKYEVDIND